MNQRLKQILAAIAVAGSSCTVFAQNQATGHEAASNVGSNASSSAMQAPSSHKPKKTLKSIPSKSQKADADSASTDTKDGGAKGGQ